jgi:hypothetical protein
MEKRKKAPDCTIFTYGISSKSPSCLSWQYVKPEKTRRKWWLGHPNSMRHLRHLRQ